MTEHVLNYDQGVVPQEQSWDCGPASAQAVLSARGVVDSENDLINIIGTTVDGTNYVGLVGTALDRFLPEANYTSVYLENDPPTPDQKDQLWANLTHSIDAGYGVVMNWVAPPGNYPIGIKGSPNPSYGGGTVFHYVPALGYDDDPSQRAVWIADPGFRPFGYWISFDQCASLIPPKGYCYAAIQTESPPVTAPQPAPADTFLADVSEFQPVVDDSYPYKVLSIRVCDGTYQDHNFAQNYAWMRKALDSGQLTFGILYTYVRPSNWASNGQTMMAMIDANGGLHPRCALMLDVESGGNPSGDQSVPINNLYNLLGEYASNSRVIGYGNVSDLNGLWPNKPAGIRLIVAGYGSNPDYPGKVAHQYTDGTGFGNGLPEGCPPFGNCDMNSADGLDPDAFALACGVGTPETPPAPSTPGPLMALTDDEQAELLAKVRDLWDQARGPGGEGWPQLNGHTPVDAQADLAHHLGLAGYLAP